MMDRQQIIASVNKTGFFVEPSFSPDGREAFILRKGEHEPIACGLQERQGTWYISTVEGFYTVAIPGQLIEICHAILNDEKLVDFELVPTNLDDWSSKQLQIQLAEGEKYQEEFQDIRKKIAAAGFFTAHLEIVERMARLPCTGLWDSKRGFSGNSFWVGLCDGSWYLGTWAPFFYRFRSKASVVGFCIEWLRRYTSEIRTEVDSDLVLKWEVDRISEDEVNSLMGE